jgi:hypothetical protein
MLLVAGFKMFEHAGLAVLAGVAVLVLIARVLMR